MATSCVILDCRNTDLPWSRRISAVIVLLLLVFAIYLACKDARHLQNPCAKVALFVLAIFYPDLYIMGHFIAAGLPDFPVDFVDDASSGARPDYTFAFRGSR
jgi:Flp pilus assembly protein protease CpaA